MATLNLILNQPQVANGLNTFNYTIAAAGLYNVQGQVTVPEALPTGSGSGSGQGLGSGAGGGGNGFTQGGQGVGNGGVGQGFGAGSGYPQPPVYGSNQTSGPAVSSGVSVVVKQNGSTVYTSPTLSATQSAQQFKVDLNCALNDAISVVVSSSTASDQQLSGVRTTVTIGQGY